MEVQEDEKLEAAVGASGILEGLSKLFTREQKEVEAEAEEGEKPYRVETPTIHQQGFMLI